jgi:hypothetical protein
MSEGGDSRIEVLDGDGFVETRFLGIYSIEKFGEQMKASARACIDRKCVRLLVDITTLAEYYPTTLERYKIGSMGAAVSSGLAKVSVIGTWEQIGRDQFASVVARNKGLPVSVFLNRDEAIAWLLAPVEQLL